MKKFLLGTALGFVGGFVTWAYIVCKDVDNRGDIAYEDDDICVVAGADKSNDWALGKIYYKKSVE